MIKRLISLLLVLAMVLPLGMASTCADDEETEYDADDFKTWTQGDPRWGDYVYGTTNTIRQSGCMIASIAVLIAYSDPSKRDWETFNPKILAQNHLVFTGNCIADYRVFDLEGGDNFLYLGTEYCYSLEEAAAAVKPHMEAGDYTMVYAYKEGVYSHFSPVVGWNYENDEPILWDVGSGNWGNEGYCEYGCCWNSKFPRAENGGTFYVISYKSLLTSSQDTVFNDDFDPEDDLSEERQDELDEYGARVASEWELNGMPQQSDMVVDQMEIKFGDVGTWEWHLQLNNASIGEAIEQNQKTFFDYIRAAFVFAGIMLMIYSVLLILAYALDKSNAFIDISLISLVSFGKLKVWDDEMTEEVQKQGYISVTGLFIRIAVIAVVGVLFVSGVLTKLMYQLYGLLK